MTSPVPNSFSSTPALNKLDAQVTLRQWVVLRLKPASLHCEGSMLLSVLIPTGCLSKAKRLEFGVRWLDWIFLGGIPPKFEH